MAGVLLEDMPNIGKVLAGRLAEAGIDTPAKLVEVGAERAFLRIRAFDEDACIHSLMGLEGAVQGIRWHGLDAERKAELRAFFESVKVR